MTNSQLFWIKYNTYLVWQFVLLLYRFTFWPYRFNALFVRKAHHWNNIYNWIHYKISTCLYLLIDTILEQGEIFHILHACYDMRPLLTRSHSKDCPGKSLRTTGQAVLMTFSITSDRVTSYSTFEYLLPPILPPPFFRNLKFFSNFSDINPRLTFNLPLYRFILDWRFLSRLSRMFNFWAGFCNQRNAVKSSTEPTCSFKSVALRS